MTRVQEIMKDKRYRTFRKEQIRKLRINEDKTMNVPEHIIWNSLMRNFDELKNEEDLDLFKDQLVDIANLCLLCHMSTEGFRGQ